MARLTGPFVLSRIAMRCISALLTGSSAYLVQTTPGVPVPTLAGRVPRLASASPRASMASAKIPRSQRVATAASAPLNPSNKTDAIA
ncbi:hypothetical protein K426_26220 (plasmid) [Sphingobium sp. TKS]|nr:hypothetical protein K426_26220 [Sphingobium sp. TKS]